MSPTMEAILALDTASSNDGNGDAARKGATEQAQKLNAERVRNRLSS